MALVPIVSGLLEIQKCWLKALTVWITKNCEKFLKWWEDQNTSPVSWEACMQIKKQQLELGMQQRTGSKLGKDYFKAIYCHMLI